VPSRPLEDTLYELPEVVRAVVVGVHDGGEAEVPVAAVVLRPGAKLDGAALFAALSAHHPPEALPRLVRVLTSLPMTEGFRPLKAGLRAEGLADSGGEALVLDVARRAYLPLR
jgi:acyl-CoA synthetase (AMP-forming)/AMP-acid ligase II